jgi:hypothetical protein
LSARALNVLKELATRLTGESPPKGRWTPPEELLEKLTFKCLSTARNCGSQTIHEIILWAGSKGVTVQPSYHAGKPLSAMWHDLAVRFAAGEFNQTELTQALEKSIRRRNTRIPLAFQEALLKILNAGGAFSEPTRQNHRPAG